MFADPQAFDKKLKLLWLGCGTGDSLHASALALHKALDEAGAHNVWWEGPGLHEWQVWQTPGDVRSFVVSVSSLGVDMSGDAADTSVSATLLS